MKIYIQNQMISRFTLKTDFRQKTEKLGLEIKHKKLIHFS